MRLAGLPWPHVAGRVFAGQQRRAQDSGSESQESDDEEHHPGATVETIMRDLADLNPQLDITPILCMIGRERRTDVCGEGGGGGCCSIRVPGCVLPARDTAYIDYIHCRQPHLTRPERGRHAHGVVPPTSIVY